MRRRRVLRRRIRSARREIPSTPCLPPPPTPPASAWRARSSRLRRETAFAPARAPPAEIPTPDRPSCESGRDPAACSDIYDAQNDSCDTVARSRDAATRGLLPTSSHSPADCAAAGDERHREHVQHRMPEPLVVLMHDGVHYRLLRNRRLNDWMSEVILAWPHLVTARQYRKNHFAHHKYLNTPQDPDLIRRKGDPAWVFPQAVPELARTLFRDVTGLNAPAMLKLASSVAAADQVPTGFLVMRYGFYAAVLGVVGYFGALEAFALYWIVPMFTWLVLIMRIRSIAEHHAIDEPQSAYPRTRTTQANLLERILIAPKNVNYHIEHHFFPSVPFYRLPELHALLMSKPGYREGAHVTRTYWGVLEESVGRTTSNRGKVRTESSSTLERIPRVVEATI